MFGWFKKKKEVIIPDSILGRAAFAIAMDISHSGTPAIADLAGILAVLQTGEFIGVLEIKEYPD